MKKLFSVIIVILCAAMLTMSFSAASNTTDNYNIYKQLAKKMSKVTSAETKVTRKYIMEQKGLIMGIKSNADEAQLINENGKLEMSSRTKNPYDNYMISDTYYKGGYIYLDDGSSSKIKIKTDQMHVSSFFTDLNWDLKKGEMTDITVEELNNGGYRLRYKVSNTKMESLVSQTLSLLGEDADDIQIKLSDVGYTLTVGSNGILESYILAYSMNIRDESESIKIEAVTNSKIVSLNALQKIDFPADLNTYRNYGSYGEIY